MFRKSVNLVVWLCLIPMMFACASTPPAPEAPEETPAAEAATETAEAATETIDEPRVRMSRGEVEDQARANWKEYESRMTWDERLEQMGLHEDPGPDPDPERIFMRFGKPHRIEKYAKEHAIYRSVDVGWVRPMRGVGIPFEIYRDDDEHVWVWIPEQEDIGREQRAHQEKFPQRNLSAEDVETFSELRSEFAVLDPPASSTVVRFREASEGLPTRGSFRNAPALADMNGDGFLDIVIPPQRGGGMDALVPTIFLGDGGRSWKRWDSVSWPIALNYGDVEAGDFNGDGHMDLAFAIHLTGIVVFLGDGQGNFVNASQGLPTNYPTRQLEIADVDLDGDLDLVVLSEGPMKGKEAGTQSEGRMQVILNDGKAGQWTPIGLGEYWEAMGGDWLTIGKFNDDPYPDFLASSIYFHGVDLFWMSEGPGTWKSFGRGFLPFFSYVAEVAAIPSGEPGRDDAIVTFGRFWPKQVDPNEVPHPPFDAITGIERISFGPDGPTRTPIVRWSSKTAIWALATADFDGDGIADLLFRRTNPKGMHLLLGQSDGSFAWGTAEGVDYLDNTAYDIATADVNGDGRPDLVILYEASSTMATDRNGSIRVYLNEGTRK